MATTHDIVIGVLLEDKLVEMWPDYPYATACLLHDPNFAANYTKLWLRLCHADNADNGYIL